MKPTAKKAWKTIYRLLRIAKREGQKAATDTMIYGSGFVFIEEDGEAHHIPLGDIRVK